MRSIVRLLRFIRSYWTVYGEKLAPEIEWGECRMEPSTDIKNN